MPYSTIEKRKAYLERVKCKRREDCRRFRELNPDYQKRYNTSSPERFLRRLLSHAKGRNKGFDLDADTLIELLTIQEGKCALSGVVMTYSAEPADFDTNMSIDRIDSAQGYIAGNIQLVCKRINSMKSNLTDQQFVEWCSNVTKKATDHAGSRKFEA